MGNRIAPWATGRADEQTVDDVVQPGKIFDISSRAEVGPSGRVASEIYILGKAVSRGKGVQARILGRRHLLWAARGGGMTYSAKETGCGRVSNPAAGLYYCMTTQKNP